MKGIYHHYKMVIYSMSNNYSRTLTLMAIMVVDNNPIILAINFPNILTKEHNNQTPPHLPITNNNKSTAHQSPN